jgi:hypothetical protein
MIEASGVGERYENWVTSGEQLRGGLAMTVAHRFCARPSPVAVAASRHLGLR